MSRVRIAFLGTPEFAATSLKALLQDEHYEVVGVVTQPDRPAGRKLQLTPSPVKTLALEHGLPVLTPESLKKETQYNEIIREWKAEAGVVVAFGQILTQEFLNLFPFGCVNIHGSILPRWRGAAPIQRAIEAGDRESGVTLQRVVKKLDAGDILGLRKLDISALNAQELYARLADLGTELLHIELMDYIRGNLSGIPQNEAEVTHAKKIDKSESLIDWSQAAEQIHNKVRAFAMGPGTYFQWQGKKYKVHKTKVEESVKPPAAAEVGQVCNVQSDKISLVTGQGVLALLELQPESRNRLNCADFLKSHPVKVGDRFI